MTLRPLWSLTLAFLSGSSRLITIVDLPVNILIRTAFNEPINSDIVNVVVNDNLANLDDVIKITELKGTKLKLSTILDPSIKITGDLEDSSTEAFEDQVNVDESGY